MLEEATAHATIAVTDVERAKEFYAGTLGLKQIGEDESSVRYAVGDGPWLVVYRSQFAGRSQVTVATFQVPNLEAAVQELRDRGVTFEEYDFPGLKTVDGIAQLAEGVRAAWFKDPDGNIIALGERS